MASITERKNKEGIVISYQIKVTRGRDKLTGKQLTPFSTTYTPPETWATWSAKAKERELQRVAGEFEAACKRGEILTKAEQIKQAVEERKQPTFSQYCETYIKSGSASKSINTGALYERILHNAAKSLGEIKMRDVTPVMIKNYLSTLQGETMNENTGKPLSHATVVCYYKTLHALFCAAVDDEIIPYSPMQRMKAPKPRKDEEKYVPIAYTSEQIKTMLDCLEKEPLMWRAWMILAIDSGCRNGELVALQWGDIDFQTGLCTISRNAQTTTGHGSYITTPKSKQKRKFYLNAPALSIMKKWKTEQALFFLQTGIRNEGDWCFTQQNGEMLSSSAPRSFLSRFGKKYGFPGIHPHAFRHTMATLSISNGADVVSVSKKLGHASPSITLNVYSHANDEAQKKANEILANAIYNAQ